MLKVRLFYPAASDDLIEDITSPCNPNSTQHIINTLFERPSQPRPAINLYSLHIIVYVRAICEGVCVLLASTCNSQNKQGRGGQTPPGS